jgi:hypothetical protein
MKISVEFEAGSEMTGRAIDEVVGALHDGAAALQTRMHAMGPSGPASLELLMSAVLRHPKPTVGTLEVFPRKG